MIRTKKRNHMTETTASTNRESTLFRPGHLAYGGFPEMMVPRQCRTCKSAFEGTRTSLYCKNCRHAAQITRMREWRKKRVAVKPAAMVCPECTFLGSHSARCSTQLVTCAQRVAYAAHMWNDQYPDSAWASCAAIGITSEEFEDGAEIKREYNEYFSLLQWRHGSRCYGWPPEVKEDADTWIARRSLVVCEARP